MNSKFEKPAHAFFIFLIQSTQKKSTKMIDDRISPLIF